MKMIEEMNDRGMADGGDVMGAWDQNFFSFPKKFTGIS